MKKVKVRVEVDYLVENWNGEKEEGKREMEVEVDLGIYSKEKSTLLFYLELRTEEEIIKEYIFEKCWLSPQGFTLEVCILGLEIKEVGDTEKNAYSQRQICRL